MELQYSIVSGQFLNELAEEQGHGDEFCVGHDGYYLMFDEDMERGEYKCHLFLGYSHTVLENTVELLNVIATLPEYIKKRGDV
jgi:hypothetical protein